MQKIAAGKFHSEPPSRFTSLDHLVGEREQLVGILQSECFGSLEVDHKLKLGRLYDRQVGRLLALENAAGVDARLTKNVVNVGCVAHQSARSRKVAHVINC